MPQRDADHQREYRNRRTQQGRVDGGSERQPFNEKQLIYHNAEQTGEHQPGKHSLRQSPEFGDLSLENGEDDGRAANTNPNKTHAGYRPEHDFSKDGPGAEHHLHREQGQVWRDRALRSRFFGTHLVIDGNALHKRSSGVNRNCALTKC